MYALACRHDENLTGHADVMYGLAKQATQATLLFPNLETIHSLLLQVVYEIGHPNTALTAVNTLGSAIALTNAFLLMKIDEEPFRPSVRWLQKPTSWVVEEGRRRTALMTFALDQWLSTITERTSGMPSVTYIKLLLPVRDDVWFAMVCKTVHYVISYDQCDDTHPPDIDSQGPERPKTNDITSVNVVRDDGPFARFIQILGIYGMINRYRQQYLSSGGLGAESVELRRIDNLIQCFLQVFPGQVEKDFPTGDENLLDATVLTLAHGLVYQTGY